MKKIIVIGCGGSGKSTFSRKLSEVTGLALFHLDQYYWKANWVKSDKEEWAQVVEVLCQKPNWIMDGNYGGTMDLRMRYVDTVVYLNFPTLLCLWRVIKRTLAFLGKSRPDMPPSCNEHFSLEFLHYVANYNRTRRPVVLQKLNALHRKKRIHIFTHDRQLDSFIRSLETDLMQ